MTAAPTSRTPISAASVEERRRSRLRRARRERFTRFVYRIIGLLILAVFIYFLVNFAQVVSRGQSAPGPGQTPVGVLLLTGSPSDGSLNDDQSNLVATLASLNNTSLIVLAGGQLASNGQTAAQLAFAQLATYKVRAAVQEVGGTTLYSEMKQVAAFLKKQGASDITLVSDPGHVYVEMAIASSLGLHPNYLEPTEPSPSGFETFSQYVVSAFEAGVARPFGWRLADSWVS